MTTGRLVLTRLVLGAVLVAVGGCGDPAGPAATSATSATSVVPSASAPSGPSAQAELVAGLAKLRAASFRYQVRSEGTRKFSVTGAYDAATKSRSFQQTWTNPAWKSDRVMVGSDLFMRKAAGFTWVRVEVKRLKDDDPDLVDLADPTGLGFFAERVGQGSVTRTGPHAYRGTFDAQQVGLVPSLPLGSPTFVSVGRVEWPASFTATTDANGRVSSVVLVLGTGRSPRTKATTTFSAYGQPVTIKRPSHFAEANPKYYKG